MLPLAYHPVDEMETRTFQSPVTGMTVRQATDDKRLETARVGAVRAVSGHSLQKIDTD